jgi:AcrR family transcriptional regulator
VDDCQHIVDFHRLAVDKLPSGAASSLLAMDSAASSSRRRTPRKGDLTEQRLLEQAERLLAQRPLNSIAIDEIAAAAGISRSSFYFYFTSREGLLRTLGQQAQEEVFAAAERWLHRGDEPPGEAIARALQENLALWRKRGPVLRALYDARTADPETQRLWASIARRYVDATAAQIERERDTGLAHPGPPDARAIAGPLISMNLLAFYEASRQAPSARRDRELVQALATVWTRTVYR